jgi:hypothetical protein
MVSKPNLIPPEQSVNRDPAATPRSFYGTFALEETFANGNPIIIQMVQRTVPVAWHGCGKKSYPLKTLAVNIPAYLRKGE